MQAGGAIYAIGGAVGGAIGAISCAIGALGCAIGARGGAIGLCLFHKGSTFAFRRCTDYNVRIETVQNTGS